MSDNPKQHLLEPIWYAMGGAVSTPILAAGAVICGASLIVCWPLIPVLLYLKRREEIKNRATQ